MAKAYPGVDVVALCQYLTNQLRARQGFDLLLLKELVSVMTVRRLFVGVAVLNREVLLRFCFGSRGVW